MIEKMCPTELIRFFDHLFWVFLLTVRDETHMLGPQLIVDSKTEIISKGITAFSFIKSYSSLTHLFL